MAINLLMFSAKPYDKRFFEQVNNEYQYEIDFLESHLDPITARLAKDYDGVCAFVNDTLNRETLEVLAQEKVKFISMRCAGFNNVDIKAAKEFSIPIMRVPAYSPYAVAEHTLALILGLNRKVHRAFNRVREGNFSLDGLLGFDIHGLTVGVVGTGKIGEIVIGILKGFGCEIIAFDPFQNPKCLEMGVEYASLDALLGKSDIVSLHCPLTPDSYHLINDQSIQKMKDGVMIINTSRGALIETSAVIKGLKSGKIGYLGLDVYEEEGDLFFEDLSGKVLQDDQFARLTTFHNVLITGHQAFFTENALHNIASTTLENIQEMLKHGKSKNQI